MEEYFILLPTIYKYWQSPDESGFSHYYREFSTILYSKLNFNFQTEYRNSMNVKLSLFIHFPFAFYDLHRFNCVRFK